MPTGSGWASESVTDMTTSASESSVSRISVIVPTGRPATCTWPPLTSWLAFSKRARTV